MFYQVLASFFQVCGRFHRFAEAQQSEWQNPAWSV